MPTYSYECTQPNCGEYFEQNVPIAERDTGAVCPGCGSGLFVERKISFTGLTWAPTAGGMR